MEHHSSQHLQGGPGRSRWRPGHEPAPAPSVSARLDVDLADELDMPMRTRRPPERHRDDVRDRPRAGRAGAVAQRAARRSGLLILEGLIAINVQVGDRIATDLLGAGDLIQPWTYDDDELLVCEHRLAGAGRDRVRGARPGLRAARPAVAADHAALLRRAGKRTRRLNVQRAIAAQPRLEIRLVLLMWHLAARWGKVEPGGIRLPIPLTHQLIGRLIAAERPSVSHALSRLAKSGVVTGHGDEWHLHGSVEDHLESMNEPPVNQSPSSSSPARQRSRLDDSAHGGRGGRIGRGPPARTRPLADQRSRVRRRLGGDDLGDAPEPRGPDPRRAARRAADRALQPDARPSRTARSSCSRSSAARAARSTRSSSCSRARFRTSDLSGEGHWSRHRRRRRHGSADHGLHLDRSLGSPRGCGARARHLRGVRGDPRDARQPHRRDGPPRLPRVRAGDRARACRS